MTNVIICEVCGSTPCNPNCEKAGLHEGCMEGIFEHLKSFGFTENSTESTRYASIEVAGGGVIKYGWEYTVWDGKWKNPTEPAFYLWSGLGDHDSYAFVIPADNMGAVQQAMTCLSTLTGCQSA